LENVQSGGQKLKSANGWQIDSGSNKNWAGNKMLDQFSKTSTPTPPKTAPPATIHISPRERDDAYLGIIVQFGPRWRLVLCRDQMQWIIQKKESSHRGFWRGKQYLTRNDSVLKASVRLGLLSDTKVEAVLHALPDYAKQTNKK